MSGHYDCSIRRLAYTPAWVPLKYPVQCPTRSLQVHQATDIASGQPSTTGIESPIDTVELSGCPDHGSAARSPYTWPPLMPLTTTGAPRPRVVVKQPVIRVDSYGKGQMFDLFC